MLNILLLLISFGFCDELVRFAPTQNSDYLPIYRSKAALFASGQESLQYLKKNWTGYDFEVWRKISFAQDSHVGGLEFHSNKLIWLPKSHTLTLSDLEPMPTTRFGPLVTLQFARLRKSKDLTSYALKILAPGTLITPLEMGREWVYASVDGKQGYIHFTELTGKMDLASYGLPKNTKQWLEIDKRIGTYIYFKNGVRKEISEIDGFAGDQAKIVVTNRDFSKMPDLSALEKVLRVGLVGTHIETQSLRWAQSQLPEQGLVWWRIPQEEELSRLKKSVTWDELLEKNVFSYDFDKKNPAKGIVSADGIYVTENGKTFEKVDQLGKLNVPVKVSSKGQWVAGPYSSAMSPKPQFKEYIRWHELTLQLQGHLGRAPGKLQMKELDISETRPENWTMKLDTGYKVMTLKSFNSGNSWTITR